MRVVVVVTIIFHLCQSLFIHLNLQAATQSVEMLSGQKLHL